jgi:AraC-like DNA-binding protein
MAKGGGFIDVQRQGPFGRMPKAAPLDLRIEDVRPTVRIAHRLVGVLNIPERIILDHELVLLLRGRGVVRTAEASYEFGPHHLFCIPPFLPHSFTARGGDEHVAVHFDFAPGVPSFARDPQRRRPYRVRFPQGLALSFHRVLKPSDGVEASLLELVRSWDRGTPASRLVVQAIAQRLIAELLSVPATDQDAGSNADVVVRTRIQRAMDFLDGHFHEEVSAADIARAAGLSPSRFNTVFRKWTGYSPQDYVRRLRVDRARQLLADIDIPIKAVAERCGFANPYHFSRVFHQIDGLSPTRYREAAAAAARTPQSK